MNNRSQDIMFLAEYVKNVLYFATVRQGKSLKNTADVHYFSIDNELVYENYYSDFGPLNLGCVFKYCRILNDKINQYLNKQTIVHYTSVEPKKKANSAFLLGCYGVLYLSLTPRDALKPLLVHGQYYRPFQGATQGDSDYTISLLDCLQAIKKARELGLFNFQDFDYEEYERLDKIQGGDLNWIVPGKFLALIGPVDSSVSLYHPPEMYINYFLENNVRIVIRLNKRMYDGNVFNNAGILHYDLFFPDGTCPPRHILFKFLQISEETNCAIAVHCKAGLGRTGSLIGCYLIKHYKMTSHEAIGWMRICRPGSVIGHQQDWLEKLEPWLIKMGNIYRKNTYQDIEKFPYHEFGIYSIAERTTKQRPIVFQKSPSPPPPIKKRSGRMSDLSPPVRPQNSRMKEVVNKAAEKERDWPMKFKLSNNQNMAHRAPFELSTSTSQRGSSRGAGDPRAVRTTSRNSSTRSSIMSSWEERNSNVNGTMSLRESTHNPITTFRTSQVPILRNINDAKNYLLRTSIFNTERENNLKSSITVTPQTRVQGYLGPSVANTHGSLLATSTVSKSPAQPHHRRRLGRSPSPAARMANEQSRATNTPTPSKKFLVKDASKTGLRDVFSKLRSQMRIVRHNAQGCMFQLQQRSAHQALSKVVLSRYVR